MGATGRRRSRTGRSGARWAGTSPPSRCGLRVPRARIRTRPPSPATTSAWLASSRSTSGSRPVAGDEPRARNGWRSRRTASPSSTPWHGAWPTPRAWSTTRRSHPMSSIPTSCPASTSCCRPTPSRRSRSGGTSTPSRSTSRSTGRPKDRAQRAAGRSGCASSPRRPSPTRGWMRPARVILVDLPSWPSTRRPTCGASRRTSRRRWTSASRSIAPRATRSGSSVTAPRRSSTNGLFGWTYGTSLVTRRPPARLGRRPVLVPQGPPAVLTDHSVCAQARSLCGRVRYADVRAHRTSRGLL